MTKTITDNKYNIALVVVIAFLLLGLAKASHYSERMSTYNAHMCATYGYEADCKTPLN